MTFLKPLETLSARRGSITTIFADFVRLAACSLAPRHEVDGRSLSIREDEYMEVIGRYDKREAGLLAEAFGEFLLEADKHPHTDILGTAWLDFRSPLRSWKSPWQYHHRSPPRTAGCRTTFSQPNHYEQSTCLSMDPRP